MKSKDILILEVPKEATKIEIRGTRLYFDPVSMLELPSSDYQLLGKTTDLTEEQIKLLCKLLGIEQSLKSLLEYFQSKGYVDRNPYGEKCPVHYDYEEMQESGHYLAEIETKMNVKIHQWQEAEDKVKTFVVLIPKNK